MPIVHSDWQCESCQKVNPLCGYYSHAKLHRGHLAICKDCHSRKTVARRSQQIQEAKANGTWVDGRKTKPKMSIEEQAQRNREKAVKYYHKDIDTSRARHRAFQAKLRADPDRYLVIQSRKRAGGAGLSPHQLEVMFQVQGCVCAICSSDEPGSKTGWNVDHCHATNRVRFVLCAHCNRGLGAFKDRPDIMRKAADMIEQFNNQADRPIPAILEP